VSLRGEFKLLKTAPGIGETLATNAKMIALARKAGFTIQPSPEVRGLMLLEMALPGTQPCNDAEATSLAA